MLVLTFFAVRALRDEAAPQPVPPATVAPSPAPTATLPPPTPTPVPPVAPPPESFAFPGQPVRALLAGQQGAVLAAVGDTLYRAPALTATGMVTGFVRLSLSPPSGHKRWVLPIESGPQDQLAALSVGEVVASYRSPDGGASWISASALACDATHLAVRPSQGDAVAWGFPSDEPFCLLHAPADGGPWSPVPLPSQLVQGSALYPLRFDAEGLIVALRASDRPDLMMRLDLPQGTWEALPTPGYRVLDLFADPADEDAVYALATVEEGEDVGIWRIDGDLADVQLVAAPLFDIDGSPPQLHVALAHAGRWVVVAPRTGQVYETVDSGETWTPRCDLGAPVNAWAGALGGTTARILLGAAGGLHTCDLGPGSAAAFRPHRLSPPAVGPTGRLAYVEDGRLTVVNPGEEPIVVADSSTPHRDPPLWWSPDGRRLLYQLEGPPGAALRVWDAESGETLVLEEWIPQLTQQPLGVLPEPWSPDGRRLLLSSMSTERPESSRLLIGHWVLDLEAGTLWPVVEPGLNGMAVWLDAETIRHDGPCEDVEMATCPRRVRVGPPPEALPVPVEQIAAPPGTTFATGAVTGPGIAYGVLSTEGDAAVATVLVDAAAGAAAGATQVLTGLLPIAWSPDGRLLAGSACLDRACELAVADVVSGTVHTIPLGDDIRLVDLAWAPSGTHLAYSFAGPEAASTGVMIWDRVGDEQIGVMEAEGNELFTDLGWSSDGCRLAFVQRWHPRQGWNGGSGSVDAIWTVGPDWERRWRVVPPSADAEAPDPCPASFLPGRRMIAYYGTPAGPGLGILGRHGVSETLTLLQEQIAAYQALDPDVEYVPVFHMVTTIADAYPGEDEDYNHRVAHDTIRPWIEAIRAVGGWAILDIQPAHAEVDVELDLIEPMLWEPGVHLAVDPEFLMVGDEDVPGTQLGRIAGAQINRVQARLDRIARATGQRQVLVIHQFNDRMMARKDEILDYAFVDLVWDADGFGSPHPKIADYVQYSGEPGFDYGGFKIFYRYDTPVMTPEEVLGLDPPPALVIYQ